jgi:hypothetical protein
LQKPQFSSSVSEKASTISWYSSVNAKPSMVIISLPFILKAGIRQDFITFLLNMIEQLLQTPAQQPAFVPMSPKLSRSMSISLVSTGDLTSTSSPFKMNPNVIMKAPIV